MLQLYLDTHSEKNESNLDVRHNMVKENSVAIHLLIFQETIIDVHMYLLVLMESLRPMDFSNFRSEI